MSCATFSRVTNIPTFSRSRKYTPIFGQHVLRVAKSSWDEKNIIEFTKSSFVLGRSGTGYADVPSNETCLIAVNGSKTTVIVFKIFGIERAWQNRGSIGRRPRQLFITKSQLLANKVEHDYINLLFSLYAGPDTPQYVHERIRHWDSHKRKDVLDPDDADGTRDDLPEKFSKLQDNHFPLFVTVDTVSMTLTTKKRELITLGLLHSCGAS